MPEDKPAEQTTPSDQGPIVPRCARCGLDPCIPDMVNATYGDLVGRIFVCPNRECRSVFNVELIGRNSPVIHTPGRKPV
jgi:hypothetical protein